MTNRSHLFLVRGKKYILRIPGEGTDLLIDRKNEVDVGDCLDDGTDEGICSDLTVMANLLKLVNGKETRLL